MSVIPHAVHSHVSLSLTVTDLDVTSMQALNNTYATTSNAKFS